MPIMVSYDDIDALGSAAIQAGYQPGKAEGQQSYRARQQSDQQQQARMVEQGWQNEFQAGQNREQMAAQQAFAAQQANTARDFEAQHALAQMGFQGNEAELNRRNSLAEHLLAIQQQQNSQQAGFQHDTQMEQQRNTDISGRQTADDARTQAAKDQAGEKAKQEAIFNARIADPTLSAGDAQRWYAGTQVAKQELPVAREQQIQGRGNQNADNRMGVLNGPALVGYRAAMQGGDFSSPLQAAQQILKPDERATAIEKTIQGAVLAASHMDPSQVAAALPNMPPPVQQRVIQMLNSKGQWSSGSNQAPQGNGQMGQPGGYQPPGQGQDPLEAELLRRGVPRSYLDQIKSGR